MNRTAGATQPQKLLRAVNDRACCELLLEHGALTRRQLAALTGLSKPATTKITARLMDDGVLQAVGQTDSGRPGPNAEVLQLNSELGLAIGVQLTPRRIRVRSQALGSQAGPVVDEAFDPAGDIVGQVASAVGRLPGERAPRHRAVCVAVPGVLDPETGDVSRAFGLEHWRPGTAARLREALGCPVVLDNDVNLQARAERAVGSARDRDDFLLVSYGHGVGAALVMDGRVRRGAHGAAGEVTYLPLRATVDGQVPDARALARLAGMVHDEDFAWVQRVAADPDEGARVWPLVAETIAPVLCALTLVVDPQVIVLAGQISHHGGEPLRACIEAELRAQLPWQAPRLVTSLLGADGMLVGCLVAARELALDEAFAEPPLPGA